MPAATAGAPNQSANRTWGSEPSGISPQVVTATPEGVRRAAEVVVPLALAEGLPRHAEAAA